MASLLYRLRSRLAPVFLTGLLGISAIGASAQGIGLLPGYNAALYPTVLAAAKGVATPFLLQQGYLQMTGVTVTDTTLHYGSAAYTVQELYQNPSAGYYLPAAQYGTYGISHFAGIWPQQFPFVLYDAAAQTYRGHADCVGYITRLLSATGDTTDAGNAYINLMNTVHGAATTLFAYRGYVATAYQFGAAFPTLGAGNLNGWQYIAGAVVADSINNYNHSVRPQLGAYNGVRKGGFANAQGGDMLAFSYSPSSSFNGHVMILEKAPALLSADSVKAYMPAQSSANITALRTKYKVYAVPVFDCSGQQAHFRDSRAAQSGIGHGTLLVLTAPADDAPQGYIFSAGQVSGSAIHYDTLGSGVYAISVGRWKTAAGTGIAAPGAASAFGLIYPNPAGDVLRCTFSQPFTGTLEIVDAAGHMHRTMALRDASTATAELRGLPAGAYWLRASGAGGTMVRGFEKR